MAGAGEPAAGVSVGLWGSHRLMAELGLLACLCYMGLLTDAQMPFCCRQEFKAAQGSTRQYKALHELEARCCHHVGCSAARARPGTPAQCSYQIIRALHNMAA